jgi:hypothetical protein
MVGITVYSNSSNSSLTQCILPFSFLIDAKKSGEEINEKQGI